MTPPPMRFAVLLLFSCLAAASLSAQPVVRPLPSGTRGYDLSVLQERREIPVAYAADVLVLGDGLSAVCAAVAAARAGADTMLVGEFGFLGGDLTAGLRGTLLAAGHPEPHFRGASGALDDILKRLGPDRVADGGEYDIERLKMALDEACGEAGVHLLLHTFVSGAVTDGARVPGVIVTNKAGRQCIAAGIVIDTTPRSRVSRAARSAAPFSARPELAPATGRLRALLGRADLDGPVELPAPEGTVERKVRAWPTLGPRRAILEAQFPWQVPLGDTRGLAQAEAAARREMQEYLRDLSSRDERFREAFSASLSLTTSVFVWEAPAVVRPLSADDVARQERFRDTVALAAWGGDMPYRALLSSRWQNVLLVPERTALTRRGGYIDDPALAAALGQAAGVAAAMSVAADVGLDQLDLNDLQAALAEQGQRISRPEKR
jgi:hypothetical protein